MKEEEEQSLEDLEDARVAQEEESKLIDLEKQGFKSLSFLWQLNNCKPIDVISAGGCILHIFGVTPRGQAVGYGKLGYLEYRCGLNSYWKLYNK